MIHLFINAGSATAGGGLTYVRNVVPQLLRRDDLRATILLSAQGEQVVSPYLSAQPSRLHFVRYPWEGSAAYRFWQEQCGLARMIRACGADVLLSTGNVALRNSPVPQILLSGNALYSTPEFFRDLRARHDYLLWMTESCKGVIAKRSVRWAECPVAPSLAFAQALEACTQRKISAVHHGFEAQAFGSSSESPEELRIKLEAPAGCLRLLFVSHYNYYRNFETLFRAVGIVRRVLAPKPVRLFLTCRLRSELNPGSYRADSTAALVSELGIGEELVQLGAVSYEYLHHLYGSCDMYVTPAYAESFAHPLVEAMASGLPIVASDLAVHREICGDAAIYAGKFSATEFAEKILWLAASPKRRQQLSEIGRRRSGDFSWAAHLDQISHIAKHLAPARLLPIPCMTAAAS